MPSTIKTPEPNLEELSKQLKAKDLISLHPTSMVEKEKLENIEKSYQHMFSHRKVSVEKPQAKINKYLRKKKVLMLNKSLQKLEAQFNIDKN